MKSIQILLITIFSNFSYSQCLKNCNIEKSENIFKDGVYYGCLDDNDIPMGYGKLKMDDNSIYEGCWKYGKREGEGIFISKNSRFKGLWKNNKMNGYGEYNQFFENGDSLKQKGIFKNNFFFSGIETYKFENNIVLTKEIENGDLISEKSNIKNYYNKKDIIGDEEYTKLNYVRRDNHFWIKMEINGSEGEWIFDTGGSGLSIGKKLWNRMTENGVNFKDLSVEVESRGAAGGSTMNKYVQIDEIILGDYKILNVIALVRLSQNNSLMGAQFYDKFSNVKWDMKDETVIFFR